MRNKAHLPIVCIATSVASIGLCAAFGACATLACLVAFACAYALFARARGRRVARQTRVTPSSIPRPKVQTPMTEPDETKEEQDDPIIDVGGKGDQAHQEDVCEQEACEPEADGHEADGQDALAPATQGLAQNDANTPVTLDSTPVPDLVSAESPEELPDEDIEDDEGEGTEPNFTWESIESRLLNTTHFIRELRRITEDIEKRALRATEAELHFASRVRDTGVLEDEKLPDRLNLVELTRSGMLYLQGLNAPLPHKSYLRLLSLEGCLNAMHVAGRHSLDLSLISAEDLDRFSARLMRTALNQAPFVDCADWSYLAMPWQMPFGPAEHGEWSTRHALSEALESLRLPWRLKARFRANVAHGDLAIEFDATPAEALPKQAYLSELGMVPTTRRMRERDASRYAARIGLLLAACSFNASRRVRRVWVQAIEDDPHHHRCLFSACLERRAFSRVNLNAVADPIHVLASLGATLNEDWGILVGCRQLFHLGETVFCPPHRHDLLRLSERLLPASCARSLGARRVLDLSISEELPRIIAADDICRSTDGTSAEAIVRAIMNVRDRTSDLSVWEAAERCARLIVEGTLPTDDPEALRREMVEGDAMSRTLMRAQAMIERGNIPEVVDMLERELANLDRNGYFRDTEAVAYRSFDSFAERVLYNRQATGDGRAVALVPESYLIAHVTLASLLISGATGDKAAPRRALAHSSRVLHLAPFSAPAHILHATCLYLAGDATQAQDTLRVYLEHAFHPQGIGLAYLRLAEAAAAEGDADRAYACYQMCLQTMPALMPVVFSEARALQEHGVVFPDDLEVNDVLSILERAQIPIAPTQMTYTSLIEGACASIDAEVFPVARELMGILEALTGDDVIHTIRKSLEREPDA